MNSSLDLEFPPANLLRDPATESSGSEAEVSVVSDCESSVSGSACDHRPSFADENGLIELPEGDKIHDLVKRRLVSCLGSIGEVVSVLRNGFRSANRRAKLHAFHVYAKAVEQKHGGVGNVKYGWCAVKRDEVGEILEHGFNAPSDGGFFGRGLYLSPDNAPQESLRCSAADGDGMRFLLLSRVILGKSEVVRPYSGRSCPSSPEFDSGVDNLQSPRKYVVWSTHMNTHVLPEILVCVKAPANLGSLLSASESDGPKRPNSPFIPFPALLSQVSKFLSPYEMRLVMKHYSDQRGGKISRFELVQRIRRLTGDELLKEIISTFRDKAVRILSRAENVQRG
ncbi:PREDICTED: probable inactive poly [ADP-ribose] polymerase SRO5 [Tarenaya hassleriana]|uniref:probable inactive poly [ADP-ribose] polymerase SRO5 n=1 Tax=Tarenaya hassleriana TaxID=28532 RepID=UPI00053C1A05|nr:PREDICTED: probable inactive poly [ADP-ribose] polymerase SRO5 [Tarenaya hassleriana]